MGISLEKVENNATKKFIEEIEILQSIGVEVFDIQSQDTIRMLAEKSGISEEKLQEVGLNPNEKIGQSKKNIANAYRETGSGVKPTEEQIKRLLELGISLDKKDDVTSQLIETLIQLQKIGIDVSKLTTTDTIKSLAEKSGIDEDEIKKLKLNPNTKIGSTKTTVSRNYRGDKGRKGVPPTKEQINRLLQLGISLEKVERNAPQELIETLEQLKKIGVDVSKLTSKDTVQSLAQKSGKSVDHLIKFGLDPKEKIGSKKVSIGRVFSGKEEGNIPTEEQLIKFLELGISFESKIQQAKQQRDEAKAKNDQAKELENQISKKLEERGQVHEEQ